MTNTTKPTIYVLTGPTRRLEVVRREDCAEYNDDGSAEGMPLVKARDFDAACAERDERFQQAQEAANRADEAERQRTALAAERDALRERYEASLRAGAVYAARVERLEGLATRLLDFIDNEGPPAREWRAITDTAAELRAAITASCAACGGKGSRDHVVDGVVESSDQCPACRAALSTQAEKEQP